MTEKRMIDAGLKPVEKEMKMNIHLEEIEIGEVINIDMMKEDMKAVELTMMTEEEEMMIIAEKTEDHIMNQQTVMKAGDMREHRREAEILMN